LVKVTLSLMPGAPLGSQLPAVDQRPSPAAPDQDFIWACDESVKVRNAIASARRIAGDIGRFRPQNGRWSTLLIRLFKQRKLSGEWRAALAWVEKNYACFTRGSIKL